MPGATLKRVPPSDWSPLTALRSVQAIPPRSFEYQTGTVRVCADDSRTKLYVPVEERRSLTVQCRVFAGLTPEPSTEEHRASDPLAHPTKSDSPRRHASLISEAPDAPWTSSDCRFGHSGWLRERRRHRDRASRAAAPGQRALRSHLCLYASGVGVDRGDPDVRRAPNGYGRPDADPGNR